MDSTGIADYDEADDSESKLEPTHWAELECKKMKVDELRHELMARDLDTRGLKGRLITRLQEALDAEKVNIFPTIYFYEESVRDFYMIWIFNS